MSIHIKQPLPYEEKDVINENKIDVMENIESMRKSSSNKDLLGIIGEDEEQRRKLFSVMKLISKENN